MTPARRSRDPEKAAIDRLSGLVALAKEEIARLREAATRLESENSELRRQLDNEGEAVGESAAEAAAWAAEREQVRERVEGLASGLERLLEPTPDSSQDP